MKNLIRCSLFLVVPCSLAFGIAACDSGSNPPADVLTELPGDIPADVPTDATGDTGGDATPDLAIDTPAEDTAELPDAATGDTPLDPADDTPADAPPDTQADLPDVPGMVQVRFLNLSPQFRDLDLFVNQATPALVSGLAFAEGSAYQAVAPGSTRFDVAPTGDGLGGSLVNTGDFPLSAGTWLTLFAQGTDDEVKLGGFPDDYEDIPAGQVRTRLAHVASDLPPVDLFLVPEDGSPIAMGQFQMGQVAPSTVDLPAGRIVLAVDINSDAMPDWTFTTPAISEGNVVNLVLVKADGEVFVLAQANNSLFRVPQDALPPGKAHVRVLNLAADGVDMQVSANGGSPALFPNLAFETDSGWMDVDPGAYAFTFASADPDAVTYAVSESSDLAERKWYTLVGLGASTSMKAALLEEDDTFLGRDAIRFRLIHAAPGMGAVDLWGNPGEGGSGGVQFDQGMALGTVGSYHDTPTMALVLGLDKNGDLVSETFFTLPTLWPGAVVNLFLMQTQGTPYLVMQEPDGTLTRIAQGRDLDVTRVRAMNLADTGTMDLYADGIGPALITEVAVGQGSAYVEVIPGPHSFLFADTGAGITGMMVETAPFECATGTDYTLLAYANRPDLRALVLDDTPLTVPSGQYHLRVVHAAWGVDALQVYEGDDILAPRVSAQYGEAPAWDRDVGAFRLGISTLDYSAPQTLFRIPAVATGATLNVYIVAAGDVTWLVAQFPDGTTQRIDADL
jgi:hypothetical protein